MQNPNFLYIQDLIFNKFPKIFQKTEDGYLITVYRPIMDKNGKVVAVIGVDFGADEAMAMLKQKALFLVAISLICLAASTIFLNF